MFYKYLYCICYVDNFNNKKNTSSLFQGSKLLFFIFCWLKIIFHFFTFAALHFHVVQRGSLRVFSAKVPNLQTLQRFYKTVDIKHFTVQRLLYSHNIVFCTISSIFAAFLSSFHPSFRQKTNNPEIFKANLFSVLYVFAVYVAFLS